MNGTPKIRCTVAEAKARIDSFPNWYHRFVLAPGLVTPGVNDSSRVLELLGSLGLPDDCQGLRVLDVGARDGFFSFELERRGADVLAVDFAPPEKTGFPIVRDILGSKVPYEVANVYDLEPKRFGRFDIVLFLGVLYHLRNPLMALDRLREVCAGRLWIETQVIDEAFLDPATGVLSPLRDVAPSLLDIPVMQFYPGRVLNNDPTNWWAPNLSCLKAMLEDADFVVDDVLLNGSRGLAGCSPDNSAQRQYLNRIERSVV